MNSQAEGCTLSLSDIHIYVHTPVLSCCIAAELKWSHNPKIWGQSLKQSMHVLGALRALLYCETICYNLYTVQLPFVDSLASTSHWCTCVSSYRSL